MLPWLPKAGGVLRGAFFKRQTRPKGRATFVQTRGRYLFEKASKRATCNPMHTPRGKSAMDE